MVKPQPKPEPCSRKHRCGCKPVAKGWVSPGVVPKISTTSVAAATIPMVVTYGWPESPAR